MKVPSNKLNGNNTVKKQKSSEPAEPTPLLDLAAARLVKTQEKLPRKRNFITKFSKSCLKWLKFTYFVDNTSKCIPEQIFFGKL